MRSLLLPALLVPLMAGCAATDGYPSLLPRTVEKGSFAEPEAPPAAPVAPDPALDAMIAKARADLDAGAASFARRADEAERRARAATGQPAGSDRWLDAQVALADLDALRSASQSALGALEDSAATRAQALQPAYPGLQEAIDAGRGAVAAQSARIAAIQAMLAPA